MKKIICDHCKKEFEYDPIYSDRDVCHISILIPEYDADSESFKSTRLRVNGDLCGTCLDELYNKIKFFVNTQEEMERG